MSRNRHFEKVRENLGISLPSAEPVTITDSTVYNCAGSLGDEAARRRQANRTSK